MENSDKPTPAKKSKKNKSVIVGVVIAVVAVLGFGFWNWHNQPSFCNAICHTPMDSYVETYYSGDSSMLAAVHEKEGKRCLDCHEAKIDEQVHEATAWITGDYQNPIPEYTVQYDESFCLNKACHNLTRDELTQKTSYMAFNPHDQRHGDIACSTCHNAHSQSVMYCTKCHTEAEIPDGWQSYSDYEGSRAN